DRGDLEHAEDPWISGDDPKCATRIAELARAREQHAHPGRVDERAVRQVDHDRIGRETGNRRLESGRRREVELTADAHYSGTGGGRLAMNVKIVRRGHANRV